MARGCLTLLLIVLNQTPRGPDRVSPARLQHHRQERGETARKKVREDHLRPQNAEKRLVANGNPPRIPHICPVPLQLDLGLWARKEARYSAPASRIGRRDNDTCLETPREKAAPSAHFWRILIVMDLLHQDLLTSLVQSLPYRQARARRQVSDPRPRPLPAHQVPQKTLQFPDFPDIVDIALQVQGRCA